MPDSSSSETPTATTRTSGPNLDACRNNIALSLVAMFNKMTCGSEASISSTNDVTSHATLTPTTPGCAARTPTRQSRWSTQSSTIRIRTSRCDSSALTTVWRASAPPSFARAGPGTRRSNAAVPVGRPAGVYRRHADHRVRRDGHRRTGPDRRPLQCRQHSRTTPGADRRKLIHLEPHLRLEMTAQSRGLAPHAAAPSLVLPGNRLCQRVSRERTESQCDPFADSPRTRCRANSSGTNHYRGRQDCRTWVIGANFD